MSNRNGVRCRAGRAAAAVVLAVASCVLTGCAVAITGTPSAVGPAGGSAGPAGSCQEYVTGSEVQQDLGAPVAEVDEERDACRFWLGRPGAAYLTAGPLSGAYLQVEVRQLRAGEADELPAWVDTSASTSGPFHRLGDSAYFELTPRYDGPDSPGAALVVRSGSVFAFLTFSPEVAGDRVVTGDLRTRLAAVAERILARL